jgi:hypothetical protein
MENNAAVGEMEHHAGTSSRVNSTLDRVAFRHMLHIIKGGPSKKRVRKWLPECVEKMDMVRVQGVHGIQGRLNLCKKRQNRKKVTMFFDGLKTVTQLYLYYFYEISLVWKLKCQVCFITLVFYL